MSERHDERLIERWLPIAEIGLESVRERTAMTPFPAPNRLHVWWARRPLVASRAAVLASLLPASSDHKHFLYQMGIHGDPMASKIRIAEAKRTGVRFEGQAYSYRRAFTHNPGPASANLNREGNPKIITVLDPTAGGGSIPFEAARLGLAIVSNDLNPVAAFIQTLTVVAPRNNGEQILIEFEKLAKKFTEIREERLSILFPPEPASNCIPTNYLWARQIQCPYCSGLIPLSPNWRLAPNGTSARLISHVENGPNTPGRHCTFEIVRSLEEQSKGTVKGGDAECPFRDCGRIIDGEEIKRQAQAGKLGEQLFAVVYKRRIEKKTKTGKTKISWERGYRASAKQDDVLPAIRAKLEEKIPLWEARNVVPTERYPSDTNDSRPLLYGMPLWRDLFNPRQLYGHCVSVEIFQDLLVEARKQGKLDETKKAAFGYLSLSLDRMLDWNSRLCTWYPAREVVGHTFQRHDFAFVWQYAEMSPLIAGVGYDWSVKQTGRCIRELIQLCGESWTPLVAHISRKTSNITITNEDARHLSIDNASIDCIVMDPPYYANVMYAELSDFFYVWLKRTAGLLYPELFRSPLTDKESEAVANPARFAGTPGATARADLDYREKMAEIFKECRRVLKPDGIMTLMFTHKASGAWDALAQGLIESRFVITASWPINTEPGSSLHIRDKAAANSTIFLVCRPQLVDQNRDRIYWDELEGLVRKAVRKRIPEFQAAGIRGVDLYLASFGPALQIFSEHWPVSRITPRPVRPAAARKRKAAALPIETDPYAVTPEDALDAARAEVKRWRLEHLSSRAAREGLDPVTSWFVLAWDAFNAAVFPYDEALRLAHVCGVNLDSDIVKHYAAKKNATLVLWDSAARAAAHALGPPSGGGSMLDAVHHAAWLARSRSLDAARAMLKEHGLLTNPKFLAAFDAVRQVLPVAAEFSGVKLPTPAVGAGDDFRALENLRKLLFVQEMLPPQQLSFESLAAQRLAATIEKASSVDAPVSDDELPELESLEELPA